VYKQPSVFLGEVTLAFSQQFTQLLTIPRQINSRIGVQQAIPDLLSLKQELIRFIS
jgi:hypothetical protein